MNRKQRPEDASHRNTSTIEPASALEVVTGSLFIEGALTAVGALAGGALAPLLPVLSKSIASGRQHERVVEAITHINGVLHAHSEALRHLSDAQYKLINEITLTVLHTTDAAKINYLRRAVVGALNGSAIPAQDAAILARIVRDISAAEVDFLVRNFGFERIQLANTFPEQKSSVLNVSPDSSDGLVVAGLISLGLLVAAEPTWDESGLLRFTSLVAKLLALLDVQ
jgi:hypothetical protein